MGRLWYSLLLTARCMSVHAMPSCSTRERAADACLTAYPMAGDVRVCLLFLSRDTPRSSAPVQNTSAQILFPTLASTAQGLCLTFGLCRRKRRRG